MFLKLTIKADAPLTEEEKEELKLAKMTWDGPEEFNADDYMDDNELGICFKPLVYDLSDTGFYFEHSKGYTQVKLKQSGSSIVAKIEFEDFHRAYQKAVGIEIKSIEDFLN